jgi:alkylation response protein AidB-like acyl-CoA dehydrogenase
MEFDLTPEQKAIELQCQQFASSFILPVIRTLEEDSSARQVLFRKMGEQGFFLLSLPEGHGGGKGGSVGYLAGLKAIAKADAGIAVAMSVTNMVAEAILHYGNSEQFHSYLPKIGNGTCAPLSFALTEKFAGSDVKSIQTSFIEDPQDHGYFLLEGEKQFITNGDISSALIVMAKDRLEKGEKPRISAFLIDRQTSGLKVIKKESKLGLLTANLVTLSFEGCRIPKTSLLGQQGEGLKISLGSLDSGRLGISAQAVGIAEAAFEAARDFAHERHQFGCPIANHQAIAFKLADMRVKLDAATLIMYKAAWLKDHGRPFTMEAAEAKLFCSERCNEIASDALQIHGGYGYIKDYPAEKYFRDARVTTIYEGTSEILRIVISRLI